MNFLNSPWVILWLILAAVVAGLAFYRRILTSHEDDIVHVSGEGRVLSQQVSLGQKLEKVDYWGKTLTIVLVAYGLLLGGWMIYQGWVQSARLS